MLRYLAIVFALIFTSLSQAGVYTFERWDTIAVDQYPFMLAIEGNPMRPDAGGCTGSLIAEDLMITAGHCFAGRIKLGAERLQLRDEAKWGPKGPLSWDGYIRPLETLSPLDVKVARVIWLNGRKPLRVPTVQLEFSEPKVGQEIFSLGFPFVRGGLRTKALGEVVNSMITLKESFDGFVTIEDLTSSSVETAGEVYTVYNASQAAQNSGGPVISKESGKILAIVSGSSDKKNLDPKGSNPLFHSWGVPMHVAQTRSQILTDLSRHSGTKSRRLRTRVEVLKPDGARTTFPLTVYELADSSQLRVEFLNGSYIAELIDQECTGCKGRYQLPAPLSLTLALEKRRVRIESHAPISLQAIAPDLTAEALRTFANEP